MADIIQFVPSNRGSHWNGDLANVDWRWRDVFRVVRIGYPEDIRRSLLASRRLMSARMCADRAADITVIHIRP